MGGSRGENKGSRPAILILIDLFALEVVILGRSIGKGKWSFPLPKY